MIRCMELTWATKWTQFSVVRALAAGGGRGVVFFRSFPSLVFPASKSFFSICCKVDLKVLNSLNF